MGKNSPSFVLKTVFEDIANLESVIKKSKKVSRTLNKLKVDDENEVQRLLEATRSMVKGLKEQVAKIDDYLSENCNTWNHHLSKDDGPTTNGHDLSNSSDGGLDRRLESKTNPKESDVNKERVKADDELEYNKEGSAKKSSDHQSIEDSERLSKQPVNDKDGKLDINNMNNKSKSANMDQQSAADEIDKLETKNKDQSASKKKTASLDEEPARYNQTQEDGNPTKLNESASATESATETEDVKPKIFLKCIDINKLRKPEAVSQVKSPSPTHDVMNVDDSVFIISDSDQEGTSRSKRKNIVNSRLLRKPKQKETDLRIDRNLKTVNILINTSKCLSRSGRTKDVTENIISDTNSDSSDSDSYLRKPTRSSKKRVVKNLQPKLNLSDTSSCSDSDTVLKPQKPCPKSARKPRPSSFKHNKKERQFLDVQTDAKFTYKTYVPLPRIPCERLKKIYEDNKEIDEINRLTNLSSLKRTRSTRKAESTKKDHNSSSDVENVKPKTKRTRRTSKNSLTSKDDSASEEFCLKDAVNVEVEPARVEVDQMDEAADDSDKVELDTETVQMLMDGIKSGTDVSANEDNTEDEEVEKSEKKLKTAEGDKLEKPDKADKVDEDKKKEKDENSDSSDKQKKNQQSQWRRNKLLTAKISDTDSEDEFIKSKKGSKQEPKARICKKKTPNVIASSDSESEADKEKNKDSSGDEFKPSQDKKSSSSDSDAKSDKSDDEEKEAETVKKKRSRIKRIKDSSDEDDKTTRKTIRRVIAHDSLAEATKQAEKEEQERKARIAERQKRYNIIFDSDKPEDAIVDKLVLDFNEKSKEEILAVHEDLVKKLKPHQAKGVQFMWNACFESVERSKNTHGSGCILAHCMGLGKTLQVITLVHTLMTSDEMDVVQRVLVVCPLNTVLNWVAEFKKWLQDVEGPEIEVFDLVTCKQNYERKYRVREWTSDGGVLIMGYDMFRNLTNPTNKRIKKSEREIFQKGLVSPGPDLVVCDEGHLLKNEKTGLSIAMNRIKSVRRIVLTGTPMQNNLKEYYCMVQFVKPNLLGTYKEYLNRFVNPITNGQYTNSTQHDINVMRKRSHVLHKMLDGIVQRKDYAVLMPYLPPKYEYVLFLTLSEVQIKLYRHYLEERSRRPCDTKMRTTFLFMDFQEFQRICTHPRVLLNKSQEINKKQFLAEDEDSEGSLKDFIDDDDDGSDSASSSGKASSSDSSKSVESVKSDSSKGKKKAKGAGRVTRNSAAVLGIDVQQETEDAIISTEWWSEFCKDDLDNIAASSKLYLLFEILQQCELIGDKLLVFSQSLYSLTIIEYFLARIDEATQKGDNKEVSGFSGSWALGLDYFRLDGSSSCDNRSAWCQSFNNSNNPRARLFLISTKAGGLGINLVGANRVVIFDVSWNPSHDIQSIYRVYRFGQTKPCYIYRFVTNGTMEMKIYERQVTKQAISKRVIDEQQIDRHFTQNDLAELYNFDPLPPDQPTPLVPKDVLLAELMQKEKDRIFRYHEHQSLLENKEDEELDEAERKAAWEEFENEKTMRVAANTAGGVIMNIPVSSIASALYNIVHKDNPDWTPQQVQAVVPLIVTQLRDQVDKGEMMLYNRVVNELKLMQVTQQQRLQQFYLQQQMRLLRLQQQQQQQQGGAAAAVPGMGFNFGNALRTALGEQSAPTISNEIVELND